MKGHDLWQYIEGFLKRAAWPMVMPMCLVMASSGCSDGVPFGSQPEGWVFVVSPDAGANAQTIVPDGGKTDGPVVCPPVNCPVLLCTLYVSYPDDPCRCPICLPPPAGPDIGPICPRIDCQRRVLCSGGSQPNPEDPCGSPICTPAQDAGEDAGAPDTDTDAETIPHCGDGILDTSLGEECDLGPLNGVLRATDGGGCLYCSTDCRIPSCPL